MKKEILIGFIKKYYLSGLNNSAIFNIKDNNIYTEFISDDSSLLGKIDLTIENNFDNEKIIGIYDTEKLLKIINILNDEFELKIEDSYISFSDNEINSKYNLCNIDLIKKNIPTLNKLSDKYIEINLDLDFINKFIKIKNSIESNKVYVFGDVILNKFQFIFNESDDITSYGNNIKFNLNPETILDIDNIPFDANLFKLILESNKDFETGKLYVYIDGLIKFNFESSFIKSEYYLIRMV